MTADYGREYAYIFLWWLVEFRISSLRPFLFFSPSVFCAETKRNNKQEARTKADSEAMQNRMTRLEQGLDDAGGASEFVIFCSFVLLFVFPSLGTLVADGGEGWPARLGVCEAGCS